MDLHQLEYVVAVADQGGFTRAAAAMHVAQPSLSYGIRTLETELGVELFARLGRTVAPTQAGTLVIDAARRVLRDMADVHAVVSSITSLHAGHLELVALPTLAVDPLAGLIGRFRTAHPGITVTVVEPEGIADVARHVRSGRAELGFTDLTTGGTGLVRIALQRQEILAVCPPGTELDDGPLTAAALIAVPLIATPTGTSTRRLLDQIISSSDRQPNIAVEINQREAILPLVPAGAGVSLLPAALAHDAQRRGAVVRPLRPILTRSIGLLHRPGQLSPPAEAMIRLARARQPLKPID